MKTNNFPEAYKPRKLQDHEELKYGDLVTIGEDESSGYREITGYVAGPARDRAYDVYRIDPLDALKRITELENALREAADSLCYCEGEIVRDDILRFLGN